MPDQTPDLGSFGGESGSAAGARDSVLQFLAMDIAEAGGGPDVQEEILEPVEEHLREEARTAIVEGVTMAAMVDAESGALCATEFIRERMDLSEVPEQHRREVRHAVDDRLHEKKGQIAEMYDDLLTEMEGRAQELAEPIFTEWEAVL